jgi:6-phosphogluconolactonase (cycloisomerase 2 family)
MKLTKFSKALLMSALSVGVVLSVTSCVQSYTVGYLFVTGTVQAGTNGSGIISGFKIDHNTGKLTNINGLPISSGGANPVRAVLISGSRFLYVLNRGVSADGKACTTSDPCLNSNITQFVLGANGILTEQETFYTQGINPFRLIADSSGNFLYVLDHDSPATISTASNPVGSSAANPNPLCAKALGNDVNGNPITACGDITAFQINGTTGRLTLVPNTAVSVALGNTLPYFPIPANPVDFLMASSDILTLSASATSVQTYPYAGGTTVFPYTYNASNGQLTINQNSSQPLNINMGTALVSAGGYVWVLDNEPPTVNTTGASSQILPYSVGSNGALQAATSGPVPDDPSFSSPIYLVVENKGKWIYVANQAPCPTCTTGDGSIAGWVLNSPLQPAFIAGEPFPGAGQSPQCMVEDPSNQFFYTANNDATVVGTMLNEQSGQLQSLSQASKAPSSYTLPGPATWCLTDGRTG